MSSRRAADALIAAGHVGVNGRIVRVLGTPVAAGDRVSVRGRVVHPASTFRYVVLHKPVGVVTTMRDPQGRRTVAHLVPPGPRVFPVGRLDFDTSGVLLLTNDGALTQRLLHPGYGVEKTYRAVVSGKLHADDVRALRSGVAIGVATSAPAKVRVVAQRRADSVVDLTIAEGRNRQVRRMFAAVGHPVLALSRLRFGPIELGALPPGRTRRLRAAERAALGVPGRDLTDGG